MLNNTYENKEKMILRRLRVFILRALNIPIVIVIVRLVSVYAVYFFGRVVVDAPKRFEIVSMNKCERGIVSYLQLDFKIDADFLMYELNAMLNVDRNMSGMKCTHNA